MRKNKFHPITSHVENVGIKKSSTFFDNLYTAYFYLIAQCFGFDPRERIELDTDSPGQGPARFTVISDKKDCLETCVDLIQVLSYTITVA